MTTTKQYFKVKNGLEIPIQDALTVTDNGGPSVRPSLSLDFSNTKSLDSRISFTRSSTALYYDGETTVKAEVNKQYWSEDFTNAYWYKSNVTVTANATVAPDGTTTADLIVPSTTLAAQQIHSGGIVHTGYITTSIYAKAAGYRYIGFSDVHSASLGVVVFDIQTGAVVYESGTPFAGSSQISYAGNGWWRCSTVHVDSGQFNHGITILPSPKMSSGYGLDTLKGDGTAGVYLWGAQVEIDVTTPGRYMPTTTTNVQNFVLPLITAQANTPRLDFDPITKEAKGLLIEESRTNLLTYSSNFEDTSWLKLDSSISSNCIVAPDGTLTGTKITHTTTSSSYYAYKSSTIPSAGTWTVSMYMKAGNVNIGGLYFTGGSSAVGVFNLSTGTAYLTGGVTGTSVGMTHVGNGWYRCWLTSTLTSGGYVGFYNYNSAYYTLAKGDYVYIWGAQAEAGPFVSSYIPTASTFQGRPSTGWYRSKSGLMTEAPFNVLRTEFDTNGGIQNILEAASTNILTDTLVQSPNVVNNVYVTTNAGIAPDGSRTATRLSEDLTSSTQKSIYYQNIPLTSGQVYTASVYVKRASLSPAGAARDVLLDFYPGNSASEQYLYVNLGTGAIIQAGNLSYVKVEDAGDGWWRISATSTANSTAGSCGIYVTQSNGYITNGDGGSGIYVWNFQIEPASTATSIMPSKYSFSSRDSTSWYVDTTGVLRPSNANAPRYQSNTMVPTAPVRLLAEQQSTNLCLYSQSLSNWGNVYGSHTYNATTAPDGVSTADKKTIALGSTFGQTVMNSISVVAGQVYCISVYAKAAEWSLVGIWPRYYPNLSNITFDLRTKQFYGVPAYSSTIGVREVGYEELANGWHRIWIAYVADTTGTESIRIAVNSDSATTTATEGAYFWGAQVEQGRLSPSSLISTNGTAVTRAKDYTNIVATSRAADSTSSSAVTRAAELGIISGTDFTNFYNKAEGTFIAEASLLGRNLISPGYTQGIVAAIGADSYYNSVSLNGNKGGTTSSSFVGYVGSYNIADLQLSNTVGSYFKLSGSYKQNDYTFYLNGVSAGTDTVSEVPSNVVKLHIGTDYFPDRYLNGYIKKIMYYPKRLNNTEIQSLTTL